MNLTKLQNKEYYFKQLQLSITTINYLFTPNVQKLLLPSTAILNFFFKFTNNIPIKL